MNWFSVFVSQTDPNSWPIITQKSHGDWSTTAWIVPYSGLPMPGGLTTAHILSVRRLPAKWTERPTTSLH